MIPSKADQEPEMLSCLADKFGHPQWVRVVKSCSVGPARVAAAPRADKYGHVLENPPWHNCLSLNYEADLQIAKA
jgi:hypothetical protein